MKAIAAVMVVALGASAASAEDRGVTRDAPERKTITIVERGSPFWAGVAVTTGLVSVGLLGAGIYYHASWRGDIDGIRATKPGGGPITADDCGDPTVYDMNGVFTFLCQDRDRSRTLLLVGLASVPIAVASTYLGFVRVTKREVRTVALVPTLTPQTAGLALDVRW